MFDCLVAGEANVDLLMQSAAPLKAGREQLAESCRLVLGGSSAVTAHNLARLGAKVSFVCVLGTDLLGRFVEERLREAGVDLGGMRRSRTANTGITMWHSRNRHRAGLTYPGALALLRAGDVPDARLKTARHLHVGHYFLLTHLHRQAPALFRKARRLGLTTSVDCNDDPSGKWDSGLWKVLQHTDVFFPNEREAALLTGEKNPEHAARELARLARVVAVKRGAKGALIVSGDKLLRVPAVQTNVVDTTGAGDSFNAGFLARFLRGASLEDCARAAARAAARSVRRVGGTAAFEAR
ncbi:MAG: carbohydrate kinase family protein [Gammaproteobacteria bacterium]